MICRLCLHLIHHDEDVKILRKCTVHRACMYHLIEREALRIAVNNQPAKTAQRDARQRGN